MERERERESVCVTISQIPEKNYECIVQSLHPEHGLNLREKSFLISEFKSEYPNMNIVC